MTKYIDEYGLKKVANASADPMKQPTITIAKGQITLNKAAVRRMNLGEWEHYEVHSGNQSGAIIFALTAVDHETEDSIQASVIKKIGIGKIPFKYPLTKYNISTGNTALNVDLMECEEGTLVFAVLVDAKISSVRKPEEKEEEPVRRTPRQTAPFGQMTTYRESGPLIGDDGEIIEGSSGGGGTGQRIEGSDF